MSLAEEIATATRIHRWWRTRLTTMIESGTVNVDVAAVGKDNLCTFGRWLYGSSIPSAMHFDEHYLRVQRLHQRFHTCAAEVARLASEGDAARAKALMAADGEYTKITDQLIAALAAWKEAL